MAAEYPTGTMVKGTISVVDLATFTVTNTITVGHHSNWAWLASFGAAVKLLVTNTYDDSISVIDTVTNREERKIDLGLPIRVPGEREAAYGAGPNSIAVDAEKNIAYVALYNANAIAVVDLNAYRLESSYRYDSGGLRAELGCAGCERQFADCCE